jgi:hypothetical protein
METEGVEAEIGAEESNGMSSGGHVKDKDGTFAMTSDLSSYALTNQTMYIGTTAVAINRGSGTLSLSGVSISGNAGTVTDGVYLSGTNIYTGNNYLKTGLTHIRDANGDDGTISGNFTLDRAFTLPDKDGTFAMMDDISNASNLTSGTVADARLSTNVPLKNGANTFSAANTFQADVIMQANVRLTPYYYVGTISAISAADKGMIHINPSSNQGTDAITDGTNGDIVTILNVSASYTFTLDESTGNLILPSATVVLGQGDSISLTYVTTNSYNKWVCTSYVNN